MSNESVRRVLSELPPRAVPAELNARLRVMASHECQRRLRRHTWLERFAHRLDLLFRPLAVPAAGGLLSSVLLFSAMVDTLNVRPYLNQDIPLGLYTQVSVGNISPFAGDGEDVLVEVTIDAQGRVSNYSIPNGKISQGQLQQIGNLILFSTFTPATAYGQPVSGKILVALHHINIQG